MNFFPYKHLRPTQKDMLSTIEEAVRNQTHVVLHAPTGSGKTTVLCPLLHYVLHNKQRKVIFFLTSRHTQHRVALELLQKIKTQFKAQFTVADMIGKKWMCLQHHVDHMSSSLFTQFCNELKESYECEFYAKARKKTGEATLDNTVLAKKIEQEGPAPAEQILAQAKKEQLCPYEVAALIAAKADVIIADYYYLFHPHIRQYFLKRVGISLEDAIIVVDEAHNLPDRLRNIVSTKITTNSIKRAVKEARKYYKKEFIPVFVNIMEALTTLAEPISVWQERLVKREEFLKRVKVNEHIITAMKQVAEQIRKQQKASSIGSLAEFLQTWSGSDEGFSRILSVQKQRGEIITTLAYHCLDPSVVAKEIIRTSHSTVCMSATLSPQQMYIDLLGFPERTVCKQYPSPFPKKNRLYLTVPGVTTAYKKRSEQQYKNIAQIISSCDNTIPGNTLVLFPSYRIRDTVVEYLQVKKKKLLEKPKLGKEDKKLLLKEFTRAHKIGEYAILLGVSSGSFSEGIDLPGVIRGVMVVGVPLQTPDLLTKEVIKYYNRKFGRGMDYGYVYPAMNRVIQGAGRAIRTDQDKGVMLFLDTRFSWSQYAKCLPDEWEVTELKQIQQVKDFFVN